MAISKDGEVVNKQEIFILPEGDRPSKKNYQDRYAIKLHGMYLGRDKGRKVLFNDRGVVLPSVAPGIAANQLIGFLESLGSSNLYFHGLDMECLLPFLERHRLLGGV